jgi:hypothetical protein
LRRKRWPLAARPEAEAAGIEVADKVRREVGGVADEVSCCMGKFAAFMPLLLNID